MNKLMLIGRIAKELELRTTASGKNVVKFDIAVNNPYKKDSEGKILADFFECIVWNEKAVSLYKFQEKGSLIAIEGRLENQKWTDEQGSNHYKNIVICENIMYLGTKKSSDNQVTEQQNFVQTTEKEEDPFESFETQIEITDADLPF